LVHGLAEVGGGAICFKWSGPSSNYLLVRPSARVAGEVVAEGVRRRKLVEITRGGGVWALRTASWLRPQQLTKKPRKVHRASWFNAAVWYEMNRPNDNRLLEGPARLPAARDDYRQSARLHALPGKDFRLLPALVRLQPQN